MSYLLPLRPAYVNVECPIHSGFRRLLRFRTAAGYADLSDYSCIAEVWNASRSQLLVSPTVNWLNRTIEDPETDIHLEVVIKKGELPAEIEDANWSLKLISPDGIEVLVEQGAFRLFQDWIEAP